LELPCLWAGEQFALENKKNSLLYTVELNKTSETGEKVKASTLCHTY